MAAMNVSKSNIVTTYSNSNSEVIAVAVFDKNSTQKPYKLYKTSDLKSFELISSSNNPLDFDSILYSNQTIRKPKAQSKVKSDVTAPTVDVKTSKRPVKRDRLF